MCDEPIVSIAGCSNYNFFAGLFMFVNGFQCALCFALASFCPLQAFASPAPSTTPEEQQTGGSCGADLRGRANYQSPSALAALLQAQGITTLMVRNLPNSVTQKRFIEELAQIV